MTLLIRDAEEVWLDTGPFCRACEVGTAGALPQLAGFLGAKARWTREVAREVALREKGRGKQGNLSHHHHRLSQLKTLNFPHDRKGARLTEPVRTEVTQLQGLLDPDATSSEHLGEIATVLHALSVDAPLVLIDDQDGRDLADERGVACVTTRQLAAEMAASGALPEPIAQDLFLVVRLRGQPAPRRKDWVAERDRIAAAYAA